MRNKIINGAMVIDQRNAGASGTAIGYTVDRWQFNASLATKGTWQQNAGSVTLPTGFTKYLGFTSNSAYSIAAGDYFAFTQLVEGFNIADLAWGTASAQTITLSFWVRSSLTGTFGGSITNSANNRSYPFSYTISSANTWEQKSIIIAGDTTGTWQTNNTTGLSVNLAFGVGSTYSGTAGAWAGSLYVSTTGATSVVGTNGATFYITGVQLERGTIATPFEYRNYQQELAMCQRYYFKYTAPSSGTHFGTGFCNSTTAMQNLTVFPVPLRTNPTAIEQSGTASDYRVLTSGGNTTCNAVPVFQDAGYFSARTNFAVASGLTAGQGAMGGANTSSAYLAWSAEL
jgi:hypothetical protein